MKRTKFIFLVLPHVHLMDLAGPDQTLLEAIDFGAPFEIEYCGIEEIPVSTAGLKLQKQKHYSKVKISKGDYIVIPGSSVDYILSDSFKSNSLLFEWLRNAYNKKEVSLVSICAGSFVLALSGLLNQVDCTTHFKRTKQLQKLFPQVHVKENVLYVKHDRIYTSAGIASGIDLMLFIVEQLTDSYFAHKVARELVIYMRRDGESKQESAYLQFRNHIHAGIHLTQDYIVEHIQKPIQLAELAALANMSYRNFCRVFKKESGATPLEYISLIRKEKILSYLKKPDLSRIQIAQLVGLKSERQLNRIINYAK